MAGHRKTLRDKTVSSLLKKRIRSTSSGFKVTNTIFNSDEPISSPTSKSVKSRSDSSPRKISRNDSSPSGSRASLDETLAKAGRIRRTIDLLAGGDTKKRKRDDLGTQIFHVSLLQTQRRGTASKNMLLNSSPISRDNRPPSLPQPVEDDIVLQQSPSKLKDLHKDSAADDSISLVRKSLERLDSAKSVNSELKRSPRLLAKVLAIRHSHNNAVIKGDQLTLNVSGNDKFIFFKNGGEVIQELTVDRLLKLEGIEFGDNILLIKPVSLRDDAILVKYDTTDSQLHTYFRRNKLWRANSFQYTNATVRKEYNDYVEYGMRSSTSNSPFKTPVRNLKFQSPQSSNSNVKSTPVPVGDGLKSSQSSETRSSSNSTESKELEQEDFSTTISRRVTRSGRTADLESPVKTRPKRNIREKSPYVEETPAPFEPPLKYTFSDNHTFHISKSDFKTLYNNDWINDTIIDFCINYELERALEKKKIHPHEIYAFNSFFFQKLTLGKTIDKDPSYYDNVKRWLMKVDLGRYTYAIIPINEHMHWYGCIIKGILQFVWNTKFKVDETIDSVPSTQEDLQSNSEGSQSGNKIEVFVFDSLGDSHPSISRALKGFIIGYCQDKYSIPMTKDDIRLLNVKVPRQNNFNDCGIHVIYNIKKWLDNIPECEVLWHKSRSVKNRRESDKFFQSSERNNMRREIIDLLLQLHKERNTGQNENGVSTSTSNNGDTNNGDDESDDCVEFIGELSRDASPTNKGKNDSKSKSPPLFTASSAESETEASNGKVPSSNDVSIELDPEIFLVEDAEAITFITPDYKSEELKKSMGEIPVPLSFEKFMNTIFKKNMPLTKKAFLRCIQLYKQASKDRGFYNAVRETLDSLGLLAQQLPCKETVSERVAAHLFTIKKLDLPGDRAYRMGNSLH